MIGVILMVGIILMVDIILLVCITSMIKNDAGIFDFVLFKTWCNN